MRKLYSFPIESTTWRVTAIDSISLASPTPLQEMPSITKIVGSEEEGWSINVALNEIIGPGDIALVPTISFLDDNDNPTTQFGESIDTLVIEE